MTDKELLELAAKAAGITLSWSTQGIHRPPTYILDCHTVQWNPLTDDGDALRLAVKLGVDINWYPTSSQVGARLFINGGVMHQIIERTSPDRADAIRRAIVRVAAEIGKEMK